MKRFDYFKYEEKENIKHLRKMNGVKTLKAGFSLLRMALKILKSSIIAEHPGIKPSAFHSEIRKFLWHPQE